MTYTKVHEEWEDLPSTATPVTGEALDQIEQGIADAATDADQASSDAGVANAAIAAHLADGTDAHDATAVSTTGSYNTVQAYLTALEALVPESGSYAPGGTDVAVEDGGTGASTAENARTNLGLGTMATQDANAIAVTGGSVAGITDLAVADGGTGASTAVNARTNLGLGTAAVRDLTDDDTMASATATNIPSAESVKAYVDSQAAAAPGNVSSIDGQTGDVDLSGDYAAISYGTFVRRVRVALTDKTSFAGTSAEQWGTEEVTLDNAVLPKLTEVTVFAQVVGYLENPATTSALNINVEISLDGGSTWDTGVSVRLRRASNGGANDYDSITNNHQIVGTVTGDIQARAMATSAQGAADPRDLKQGHLYLEVVISQVPLA